MVDGHLLVVFLINPLGKVSLAVVLELLVLGEDVIPVLGISVLLLDKDLNQTVLHPLGLAGVNLVLERERKLVVTVSGLSTEGKSLVGKVDLLVRNISVDVEGKVDVLLILGPLEVGSKTEQGEGKEQQGVRGKEEEREHDGD